MRPIIVTGTDTGVGKTIVTAALATIAELRGLKTLALKPVQTGLDRGHLYDMEVVAGFAEVETQELMRYPDPLAPYTAARVSGLPPLGLAHTVQAIQGCDHDIVFVEGAGGLLVQMGEGGWTIADLAGKLDARCVVVTRPDLGTLNHTALTLEAMDRRGLRADLILGSWPKHPELAHQTNLDDLPPRVGQLPQGAGDLAREEFRQQVTGWFAPEFLDELFDEA